MWLRPGCSMMPLGPFQLWHSHISSKTSVTLAPEDSPLETSQHLCSAGRPRGPRAEGKQMTQGSQSQLEAPCSKLPCPTYRTESYEHLLSAYCIPGWLRVTAQNPVSRKTLKAWGQSSKPSPKGPEPSCPCSADSLLPPPTHVVHPPSGRDILDPFTEEPAPRTIKGRRLST